MYRFLALRTRGLCLCIAQETINNASLSGRVTDSLALSSATPRSLSKQRHDVTVDCYNRHRWPLPLSDTSR